MTTVPLYETHTLLGLLRLFLPPSTFWLDTFFKSEYTFETEYIDFDTQIFGRRMAPFVAPNVQGKPIKAAGYTTKRFKPAYVKPKDSVDPNRIVRRRAGEPFMGTLSLQQRYDAVVADSMLEQRNMIVRRWEWMAAEAVIKGTVTVQGDDYPARTVDFGRRPDNTIIQTGTALWSDYTNSDPIGDIEFYIQQILLSGFAADKVIMGLSAWQKYRSHPKVLAQLNRFIPISNNVLNAASLPGFSPENPAILVGTVGFAQIPLWVYNDFYEDANSTEDVPSLAPFLDPTNVIVVSTSGIQGLRCYGAILDAKAGYQPASMFPKMWYNEDPSVTFLMTQSAPLMVPTWPNASLRAKVV